MIEMYDIICLSGGGSNGFIQLGALHHYHTKGLLKDVTTYCGTSVGAIICLLLSIGYSPMTIYNETLKVKKVIEGAMSASFSMFKENWGASSIDGIADVIKDLVVKKLDKVPTLRELYMYARRTLVIVTCDLTNMQTLYISHKTHPDLSCIDAIKMSSNIPGIFTRLEIDGVEYIDGGFGDNFPIAHIELENVNSSILGICTTDFSKLYNINIPFLEYYIKSLTFPLVELQKQRIDGLIFPENHTILDIKPDNAVVGLSIDDEEARNKLMRGYTIAKNTSQK